MPPLLGLCLCDPGFTFDLLESWIRDDCCMDPIYYMVHQETDAHGKVQVQGHKLKETVQLTDKGIQSQVFSKQLVNKVSFLTSQLTLK